MRSHRNRRKIIAGVSGLVGVVQFMDVLFGNIGMRESWVAVTQILAEYKLLCAKALRD